jgi:hypothetical protein
MFRHPKYYKELRKVGNELAKRNAVKEDLACSGSSPARNKTDQAISKSKTVDVGDSVRPGPGLKLQAREDSTVNRVAEPQASSAKLKDPQATSDKHQAPRHKRQA